MTQICRVLLIAEVVAGFVFRAQAQIESNLLVLDDVYSVKVPSDARTRKLLPSGPNP